MSLKEILNFMSDYEPELANFPSNSSTISSCTHETFILLDHLYSISSFKKYNLLPQSKLLYEGAMYRPKAVLRLVASDVSSSNERLEKIRNMVLHSYHDYLLDN